MEETPAQQEEAIFNAAEASGIVKECLEVILSEVDYDQSKVNQWMASVVEQSLTHLVKLGKAYKYIVSCTVMQKSGSGLHTASSCFWDNNTDETCDFATDGSLPALARQLGISATSGNCTVRWENRTMCCVVNVFAVAITL